MENTLEPKAEETWQHCKGGIYKIYGVAIYDYKGDFDVNKPPLFYAIKESDFSCVEVDVTDQGELVAMNLPVGKYVLYYKEDFPFRVWARTLEDFMSEKEEGVPRFKKLEK